jgi:hypothetical protein
MGSPDSRTGQVFFFPQPLAAASIAISVHRARARAAAFSLASLPGGGWRLLRETERRGVIRGVIGLAFPRGLQPASPIYWVFCTLSN